MKKLKYLLFIFIALLGFKMNIKAEDYIYDCEYVNNNSKGTITAKYTIVHEVKLSDTDQYNYGENVKDAKSRFGKARIIGYFESTDRVYTNETEPMKNWNSDGGYSGYNDWFWSSDIPSERKCPQYAIFIDAIGHSEFYVSDEKNLAYYRDLLNDHQGGAILSLVDGKLMGKNINITFDKGTVNTDNVEGSMPQQTIQYGSQNKVNSNQYILYGYTFTGWNVKNSAGEWLCDDNKYSKECDFKAVISDNSSSFIPISNNNFDLTFVALWTPNINLDSQSINHYKLGKSTCVARGYVWSDKYSYCNTDNLLYVQCGDSYDIPNQIPGLISFFVNLLKIATPIILIIVSIITLFKALVSSKEDEIKKAKTSLVKKIVAAVFVFFVISIVQFVIMKVADSSEKSYISNCLSCFLNNDCGSNSYYKTNLSGKYFCTKVTEYGPAEMRVCEEFYNE